MTGVMTGVWTSVIRRPMALRNAASVNLRVRTRPVALLIVKGVTPKISDRRSDLDSLAKRTV